VAAAAWSLRGRISRQDAKDAKEEGEGVGIRMDQKRLGSIGNRLMTKSASAAVILPSPLVSR